MSPAFLEPDPLGPGRIADDQALVLPFGAAPEGGSNTDARMERASVSVGSTDNSTSVPGSPSETVLDGPWWEKYFKERSPNRQLVKYASGCPLAAYMEAVGHEPPEVPEQWHCVINGAKNKEIRLKLALEIAS